jgi:cation transport ATPase
MLSAVEAAIRSAGYEPRRTEATTEGTDAHQEAKDRELSGLKRDLTIAAIFTLPLFVLEMGSHLYAPMHHWLLHSFGQQPLYILYFVLATIVQFGPGLRFYRKGFPTLLRGAPDMNALVLIGTSAAWSYSVVATFLPGILPAGTANVYFEASAVIITLVLLGRYLEARAKGRTSEAIKRLIGLQPKTARVRRGEDWADVDHRRSRCRRRHPGAARRTPARRWRGLSGSSYVDEAMISGEPVPVAKGEGDEVVGGTINKTGSFTYRATKVGADTLLAQIIRMVEEAQGSKLPIQAMVDKVTAWFVPAVIASPPHLPRLAGLRPRAGADLRPRQCGGRAHHRLPLRDGARHPDLDHGRHRTRGRDGRAVPPRRRRCRRCARPPSSPSTRPAR